MGGAANALDRFYRLVFPGSIQAHTTSCALKHEHHGGPPPEKETDQWPRIIFSRLVRHCIPANLEGYYCA